MSGASRSRPGVVIVINADDFGRTVELNEAILDAFQAGLVSSASIMANMPAFEDACRRALEGGLVDRIGVHLNLTQGQALTAPIRQIARFCDPDGMFRPSQHTIWRLSKSEAEAVREEFAAQVEAVRRLGLEPTHLDSHHHVHVQWPIGSIVVSLAHRFGIRAVRLSRNCGAKPSIALNAYKYAFNARLTRAGLGATRSFGSAGDVVANIGLKGPIEVMVHPEHDPTGRLVDCVSGASRFEDARPLAEVSQQLHEIGRVVSFAELHGIQPQFDRLPDRLDST